MRVKKVIPKVGHFRPCQKLTKMAKKTQKKTVKNRKKRRLRHSKISVFPKMPFLDPPKNPLFDPFFLAFFKWPKISAEKGGFFADFQKTPKKGSIFGYPTVDHPWGFWSKNRHFWPKSGFLGPSNDHFLTTF